LLGILRKASTDEPDHLPLQLALIEAFATRFPQVPSYTCSDSAFHDTMPRVARLLPIPARLQVIGIERYGFHGLSCMYLMEELARIAGVAAADGRVIIAHLGSGASVTAVRHGRSVDTSMGFTPAAGLVMATRSGDLDPGVVGAICRAEQLTPEAFNRMVNQDAGLLGVSGTTGDIRELLDRASSDPRAADAIELFCYQARKWIGAFAAALGGLDTLIFAGGIGEHLPQIRDGICRDLAFLDVHIDSARNRANEPVISVAGARATVRVIPTDEEAMIARATSRALRQISPSIPDGGKQ
jgi:acetate kinase